MRAVLLFNKVNDLIFSRWDDEFLERMKTFGEQEMKGNVSDNDHYNISQLFSPIITSHRVMAAQFGNAYSSMECKGCINIAFDEWLDHVLMAVGCERTEILERDLRDFKTFLQHIVGQNYRLLATPTYKDWLTELLDAKERSPTVPGAGAAIGESGATAAAMAALRSTALKIKSHTHFHLLMFVENKLLALYSSRRAEDLRSGDQIVLSVQVAAAQHYWGDLERHVDDRTDDGITRPLVTIRVPWLSEENSAVVNLSSSSHNFPCVPYSMHMARVAPGITLLILLDLDLKEISIPTSMAVQIVHNLRLILLQRCLDSVSVVLQSLEEWVRKVLTGLQSDKGNSQLSSRLSNSMTGLRLACSTTTPLAPDTSAVSLCAALEAVVDRLRPEVPRLNLSEVLDDVQGSLKPCEINPIPNSRYTELFPGLIQLVMVNRTMGRVMAHYDTLGADKMRAIYSQALRQIHNGFNGATWRTGAMRVTLVLWWDLEGKDVSHGKVDRSVVRALPPPGDIMSSFYKEYSELVFHEKSKPVLKELLCIHIGLLPAATAIEHARRLAHTVEEELAQYTLNPADLL